MNARNEPTTVEIYGQTYNVRGEGDPAYLTEVARFVDSRMREVAAQANLGDPMKIAILAALNIADEFVQFKQKHEGAVGTWMEKTGRLARRLDDVLVEPAD